MNRRAFLGSLAAIPLTPSPRRQVVVKPEYIAKHLRLATGADISIGAIEGSIWEASQVVAHFLGRQEQFTGLVYAGPSDVEVNSLRQLDRAMAERCFPMSEREYQHWLNSTYRRCLWVFETAYVDGHIGVSYRCLGYLPRRLDAKGEAVIAAALAGVWGKAA